MGVMSTIEQVKPATVRTAGGGSGDGTGITNWWTNTRTFLTEVRNEMRRVTWPSRKEVYATTIVVILTSAFFGLYLWGLDLALDRGINWIFRQLGAA
jgi:preprotein translocase subunit SecE